MKIDVQNCSNCPGSTCENDTDVCMFDDCVAVDHEGDNPPNDCPLRRAAINIFLTTPAPPPGRARKEYDPHWDPSFEDNHESGERVAMLEPTAWDSPGQEDVWDHEQVEHERREAEDLRAAGK